MGYSFRIGEMKVTTSDEGYVSLYANKVNDDEAKALGAPLNSSHDRSNHIMPSYSGWYEFMTMTELERALECQDIRIVIEHPGVCAITKKVHDAIVLHGEAWLSHNPVVEHGHEVEGFGGGMERRLYEDYNAARMRWLVWWVKWAYANCENPVIANA